MLKDLGNNKKPLLTGDSSQEQDESTVTRLHPWWFKSALALFLQIGWLALSVLGIDESNEDSPCQGKAVFSWHDIACQKCIANGVPIRSRLQSERFGDRMKICRPEIETKHIPEV
jgi:hypothetical protein